MLCHFLHDLQEIDAGEEISPRDIIDDFDFFAIDDLDSVWSTGRDGRCFVIGGFVRVG